MQKIPLTNNFRTQVIKLYSFPALLKTKKKPTLLDMGLAKASQVS